MLSVIIYGRNDNHGYLLRKRLAMSLNCIASQLTHSNDEIIFVDYNTSSDLPTIAESIEDNLTSQCKQLLKIIRVRPNIHTNYQQKTHLKINEPLARNIGIRHSNSDNRWILSTNSDMIFLTDNKSPLSDAIFNLEDGFYLLPRFDIPEFLWEHHFKSREPEQIFSSLREHATQLTLDFIVKSCHDFIFYDNPGDFQLILRKDIFDIGGFDESMILGWHVDSNLCKRMHLIGRNPKCLFPNVMGYHCNHYRGHTEVHKSLRAENSFQYYVIECNKPLANNSNWGMPSENFEIIDLSKKNKLLDTITAITRNASSHAGSKNHNDPSFNYLTYNTAHIVPFILNHLLYLSKQTSVSYIGSNSLLFESLKSFWIQNNNQGNLTHIIPGKKINLTQLLNTYSILIFDFGVDHSTSLSKESLEIIFEKILIFFQKVAQKIKYKKNGADIKVIGINLIHDKYKAFFLENVTCSSTCYCTNVHFGNIKYVHFLKKIFKSIVKFIKMN